MKEEIKAENIESNKRFARFRKKVFGGQKEAAAFLGVEQPTISRIERGVNILQPEHRKKLVHEKGLNPKWYDTGIGDMLLTEADKKRTTIHIIQDLQDENEFIRSELNSLKKSMKLMLKTIGELKDKAGI